jgi:hypothetical protein
VARIAHSLVPRFDNYRPQNLLNRVLKVIAKVPEADPARFEALLRGSKRKGGESRDRVAGDFQSIIFSGFDGLPAARDLPDVVLSVASDYLLAPEEDLRRNRYLGASTGVDRYFGIKEELHHDSFPASGIRGPWSHLLQHHPAKALEFVLHVFNHSARSYANPRFDRLEPAWDIELTFADGSTRRQWGNPRLWNLYRGFSVGPYVLQSLLMAFESWLLNYAKGHPQQLDPVLVDILRRSESASLAAVVASVATAHPHISGEALVVLLSARDYIGLDVGRCVAERQAEMMLGIFPQIQPEHKICEAERRAADGLPHRGQSLEDAVIKLQLGPLAPRVYAILDRHKAALPPIGEQNDEDRKWRLSMHRMDLRQCTVSEVEAAPEKPVGAHDDSSDPPRRLIRFDPMEPEPDVKEMMDKSAVRLGAVDARLRILNWAYSNFKGEGDNPASYNPALWQEFLREAMLPQADEEDVMFDPARGGPGILAAVCIRDHWEEMSDVQRDWCIGRVCVEVMVAAERWNDVEQVQRNPGSPDRACAWALSLLPIKSISEGQRSSVQKALAVAVTHPIIEVRWHAVRGIAQNLSTTDRTLANRCINGLALEATLIQIARHEQDGVPYVERREMNNTSADAAKAVRNTFWVPDGVPPNAYEKLDVEEWFGADANAQILTILLNDPDNPATAPAFTRAAQTLVKWWDEDDHRYLDQSHRERNSDSETAISDRLQKFVMRTSYESAKLILEPILSAISYHPREIYWIMQGLTIIEDSTPNTPHYWQLWELFADGVKSAKWASSLNDEHPFGAEMLSAVFLTSSWKDAVRHWRSLEGHAHHVHALFEALPPSWIVLDSYLRFLYHVGERSLPEAFVRVANSLRAGDSQKMLVDSNTVFMLVVLLQRHVYGKPLELKREPTVRNAVLYLLDTLVENGSAPAFRMRDDFVTPVFA